MVQLEGGINVVGDADINPELIGLLAILGLIQMEVMEFEGAGGVVMPGHWIWYFKSGEEGIQIDPITF